MIKQGVRVGGLRPEMALAYAIAQAVYIHEGLSHRCVITGALEGRHRVGSLHYVGLALDLRLPDQTNSALNGKIAATLAENLGEDFDVILESDHLHLEFQPEKGMNF